jgi:hypothetical protein
MSAKSGKKTTSRRSEQSVLGSLPSTRPARVGRARGTNRKAKAPVATATAAKKATTKPKATKAAGTKPRATTPPPEQPTSRRNGPPSGAELATTAVRAAGELAQIGLTVGAQVLKRAASRLPRP